jgi:hypothetical protein
MQKSFLVKSAMNFGSTVNFIIRAGDILVYDSSNQNKITVYRNGDIIKVLSNQSSGGLQGLSKAGWLAEIHSNDAPKRPQQAPKVVAPVPGKPFAATQAVPQAKTATSRDAKPLGQKADAAPKKLSVAPTTV